MLMSGNHQAIGGAGARSARRFSPLLATETVIYSCAVCLSVPKDWTLWPSIGSLAKRRKLVRHRYPCMKQAPGSGDLLRAICVDVCECGRRSVKPVALAP